MTPLQILRSSLMNGAILTLYRSEDGYHIDLKVTDTAGQATCCEIVNRQLDQAIFTVMEHMTVSGRVLRAE